MKTIIFKTLCAITAFVASLVSVNAQQVPANIEISYVKGRVEVLDGKGRDTHARVGKILQEGSIITTGERGQVKLIFANGTRMVVEPDSHVQIVDFRMLRNSKTLDSGLAKLSTVKEPTNSQTHILLLKGNLLFEVAPLNFPLSLFRVDCPFFGAEVRGTVFRFEQGLEFGRLSVYKGKVHSYPKYEEFGPSIDVPAGKTVLYRFRKRTQIDDIRNPREEANVSEELLDPPTDLLPNDPDNEDKTLVLPNPPITEDPKGSVDTTLIENAEVAVITQPSSKDNGEAGPTP
ncbi:MAG: FecR domain-containing protein [Puniceicoccales bacterium]|jgi:hypothetical protein|nr:FecR domain-containing protein [Puniceicoccales bacterium]